MRAITIVLPYYLNPGMLARHYAELGAMSRDVREQLQLIIVDDGSPRDPARPPATDLGLPVQIFRVRQDVRWNQDACRNIGAHHAQTRWLLLTDIDHLIPVRTLGALLTGSFDQACVYKFARVSEPGLKPYKPHPNSWFLTRKLYDRIGGYDERFAGYYGTDADFRDRAAAVAKIVQLQLPIVRVPREVTPDASTTTYGRKEPQDQEAIPRIRRERNATPGWRTKRLTFAYDRVA